MAETLWALLATLPPAMAGLLLWRWTARRQRRQAASSHLAARIAADLASRASPVPVAERAGFATGPHGDPWASMPLPIDGSLVGEAPPSGSAGSAAPGAPSSLLARQLPGWLVAVVSPRQLAGAAGGGALLALACGAALGPVAAAGLLKLLVVVGGFVVWLRVQRFRRRVTQQLPGFIDAMVRLVRIGHSPQAAFQLSIANLKWPLRGAMAHAGGLARAGVDLDQALDQTADHLRVGELHLLGAILGVSVRYGGRADTLLERAATSLRDTEQAGHELSAMSAETRLSAWILGLLPLGVGAAITLTQPDYIQGMWFDATGRLMLFAALGLQSLGALLLYRLARLR